MLTTADLLQGLELVKVLTPEAVVWRDGVTGDHRWTVCHFVKSQLPSLTRPLLRYGGPIADRDSEANVGYLGGALEHESSDPDPLATVLDELLKDRRLVAARVLRVSGRSRVTLIRAVSS